VEDGGEQRPFVTAQNELLRGKLILRPRERPRKALSRPRYYAPCTRHPWRRFSPIIPLARLAAPREDPGRLDRGKAAKLALQQNSATLTGFSSLRLHPLTLRNYLCNRGCNALQQKGPGINVAWRRPPAGRGTTENRGRTHHSATRGRRASAIGHIFLT
jgi:hypothetical protein